MLECELIQTPTDREIDQLARGFLGGDTQYFDAMLRVVQDNMGVGENQNLLVCRKGEDDKPVGFANYEVRNPDSFDDIGEATRVFSYGRITHNDSSVTPEGLGYYEPFASYSRTGNLVFIKHIEVAQKSQRSGVASKILEKLVEQEDAELVEGMAHPGSLGFWLKRGFLFPGLRSDELTVIAWLNPVYRKKANWGLYKSSDFEDNKAKVFFFWNANHRYTFYNFDFSENPPVYDANRGQIMVDGIGDSTKKTGISLSLDQLREKVNTLEEGASNEVAFREFIESYHTTV